MSAWRIVARNLYAIGGSGLAAQFDGICQRSALKRMRDLKLIANNGKRGRHCIWTLTPLGIAWCEGRAKYIHGRTRPTILAATWLASLPRDVRIAGAVQVREAA
jgi:hypothetical protein